jgi:hypothetical protein
MVNDKEQQMTQAVTVKVSAKSAVTAALKERGLCYVGIDCGGHKRKALEPKMLGMTGGSIGPLTVTDAHMAVCRKTELMVLGAFRSLADVEWSYIPHDAGMGGNLQNLEFQFKTGKNTVRVIKFRWELRQSYSAKLAYDSSYRTYWYVMYVEDQKI